MKGIRGCDRVQLAVPFGAGDLLSRSNMIWMSEKRGIGSRSLSQFLWPIRPRRNFDDKTKLELHEQETRDRR
jgi:hypothetical protein